MEGACCRSKSNNHRFRQIPPEYPVSDPFVPTTRWHGMTILMQFFALVEAMARIAKGLFIDKDCSL